MGSWTPRGLEEDCECRKRGLLGCCNGGNRLSHPKAKVTTDYCRSRSLPTVFKRGKKWRRKFEAVVDLDVELGKLTRSASEVAHVLADHAGVSGEICWPSQKRIARRRGMSVRWVGQQVAELREKGYVAVEHRFRPTANGVRGRSNRYLLLIPGELDISAKQHAKRPSARHGVSERNSEATLHDEKTQPDPELVEQWKAALRAKDDMTVRRLAEEHLAFVPPVGIPLGIGTLSSLAAALANRGPP